MASHFGSAASKYSLACSFESRLLADARDQTGVLGRDPEGLDRYRPLSRAFIKQFNQLSQGALVCRQARADGMARLLGLQCAAYQGFIAKDHADVGDMQFIHGMPGNDDLPVARPVE